MTSELDRRSISDGVLLLRPYDEKDIAPHVAGEDDEIRHWLWNNVNLKSTVEKFTRVLAEWQEEWRTGAGRRSWAVREATSDTLVGAVNVWTAEKGL